MYIREVEVLRWVYRRPTRVLSTQASDVGLGHSAKLGLSWTVWCLLLAAGQFAERENSQTELMASLQGQHGQQRVYAIGLQSRGSDGVSDP